MFKIGFAFLDQGLVSACNFLISIMLARYLDINEFGICVFSFTVFFFAIGLLNNILCNAMSLLGAGLDDEKYYSFLHNCFGIYIFLSISLIVIFVIISNVASNLGYFDLSSVFHSISLNVSFVIGQEFLRRVFFTRESIGQVFLIDIITYVTRFSVFVLFILFSFKINSTVVINTIGLSSLFGMICGVLCIGFNRFLNFKFKFTIVNEIFSVSKWFMAEWPPFIVTSSLYIYLVTFILGNESNGVLGICRNLVQPLTILSISISSFGLSFFSKVKTASGISVLQNKLCKIFSVFSLFSFFYLVLINIYSNEINLLVFDKNLGNTDIIFLFSVSSLIVICFKPFEIYLKVTNKAKFVFRARVISASLCSMIMFPMITFFSLRGAMIGNIITETSMMVGLVYYSCMLHKK